MRVVLDGQLLDANADTLGEALARASEAAEARGRLVIEVVADGTVLDHALLTDPGAAPTGLREVCLTTADSRELVRLTLEQAAGALDDARDRQREAADLVLRGRLDDARAPLRGALETWQSVRTALDHTAALLRMDVSGLGGEGARVESLLAALHGSLGKVKETLERQDYSALSDELAFELEHLTTDWQTSLRDLAGWVGARTPGGVA